MKIKGLFTGQEAIHTSSEATASSHNLIKIESINADRQEGGEEWYSVQSVLFLPCECACVSSSQKVSSNP